MPSGFLVSNAKKIWVGMLRTASTQRSDSGFEGHPARPPASYDRRCENDCNLDNDVQDTNKRAGLIVNRMALGLLRSTGS